MITLKDAVLCAWALERPILITSSDPDATITRIQSISVDISITYKPTNHISVYNLMLLNMDKQKQLYSQIRRKKYPLVLVTEDTGIQRNLRTQLLFSHKDDLKNEISKLEVDDINTIRGHVRNTTMIGEIKTYIYDLIVELRYSRFVKGGIPTYLIFDVTDFIKFWTYIRGMKFVTPLMVKECFRIVLPLRIQLIQAEEDPSLMYGSNLALIGQLVQIINVHDVVDIAISNVTPPI